MKVKAYPLPEVFEHKFGKVDDLRSITHDRERHNDWVSTTSTLYNPNDGLVYVGLTNMTGDILYSFDPSTGKSTCLDYGSIRVDEEVKVHRSFQLAPDGRVFSASAGLINVRTRDACPGGQVWSYDPERREYEVYGIPCPHDYIQHVVVDFDRQMAYGCTYPVPWFFAFDLKKRVTKRKTYIGAYPHRSAVADNGHVWTGYSMSADISDGENMLMSYDPDNDEITWHDKSLPTTAAKHDNKQIDDIVNLDDGYLYAGTVNGAFCRIDPKTADVEWLGKPARGMRLCGIDEGTDGLIYMATGAYYGMKKDDAPTHIYAYDRDTKHFTDLGVIYDPEFDDLCVSVHSLSIDDDNTLWVGETDNADRSGCLWECRVK